MELSRQEYWSGLPFPSPGDLPDPGIKPGSPASQVDSDPMPLLKVMNLEGAHLLWGKVLLAQYPPLVDQSLRVFV